jgi:hypothetical protein
LTLDLVLGLQVYLNTNNYNIWITNIWINWSNIRWHHDIKIETIILHFSYTNTSPTSEALIPESPMKIRSRSCWRIFWDKISTHSLSNLIVSRPC